MNNDELAAAVDTACESGRYAWVVGVLEGAIRAGWDAQTTAQFLREQKIGADAR